MSRQRENTDYLLGCAEVAVELAKKKLGKDATTDEIEDYALELMKRDFRKKEP